MANQLRVVSTGKSACGHVARSLLRHGAGANPTAANLHKAILTNADLTGATLTSALLGGSNLSETNFTGAIGSLGPDSNATWFETTCPNGTVTNTGCW